MNVNDIGIEHRGQGVNDRDNSSEVTVVEEYIDIQVCRHYWKLLGQATSIHQHTIIGSKFIQNSLLA
jgi:hypothetical protein